MRIPKISKILHYLSYPRCTCGERITCTKRLVIKGTAGVATVEGKILECGHIKKQMKALSKIKVRK